MMRVIETWEELRDWALMDASVKTANALAAYERAMQGPTLGRIFAFWCADGLGQNQGGVTILWWDIREQIANRGEVDLLGIDT